MKLTTEQFNALPEAIKKRNPNLFLGAVDRTQPKQDTPQSLDRGGKKCKAIPCSVVISLIRFGRRKFDSQDNLPASCKPLVDGIAARLGVDDADPRLRWQYGQCETYGETGTLVVIECV